MLMVSVLMLLMHMADIDVLNRIAIILYQITLLRLIFEN